ncbi:MAG: hypothetical protein WCH99_11730 [Verrucomicrobiota bacterium]
MKNDFSIVGRMMVAAAGVAALTGHAKDTNLPVAIHPLVFAPVPPAEYAAFTNHWTPLLQGNESGLFDTLLHTQTNSYVFINQLLGALETDAANRKTWCLYLMNLLNPDFFRWPANPVGLTPPERMALYHQVGSTLERAIQASPGDFQAKKWRVQFLEAEMKAGFKDGTDFAAAQASARTLITIMDPDQWNYCMVAYGAHATLGRIALQLKDPATARKELRAAGQLPISVRNFAPDFTLPGELLQNGEPADRETVCAFLDDVAAGWGWANPAKNLPAEQPAAIQRKQDINRWKEEISAGKIPQDKPYWIPGSTSLR